MQTLLVYKHVEDIDTALNHIQLFPNTKAVVFSKRGIPSKITFPDGDEVICISAIRERIQSYRPDVVLLTHFPTPDILEECYRCIQVNRGAVVILAS